MLGHDVGKFLRKLTGGNPLDLLTQSRLDSNYLSQILCRLMRSWVVQPLFALLQRPYAFVH